MAGIECCGLARRETVTVGRSLVCKVQPLEAVCADVTRRVCFHSLAMTGVAASGCVGTPAGCATGKSDRIMERKKNTAMALCLMSSLRAGEGCVECRLGRRSGEGRRCARAWRWPQ
eukprot:scaffold178277_cov24-Tisochrysis_lutea.AAC.4